MNLESIVAGALVAISSHVRQGGGDAHAVVLVVDTVSGAHALQALPAIDEAALPLCCALRAAFRAFVASHPELAERVALEIAQILEESPGAELVH